MIRSNIKAMKVIFCFFTKLKLVHYTRGRSPYSNLGMKAERLEIRSKIPQESIPTESGVQLILFHRVFNLKACNAVLLLGNLPTGH